MKKKRIMIGIILFILVLCTLCGQAVKYYTDDWLYASINAYIVVYAVYVGVLLFFAIWGIATLVKNIKRKRTFNKAISKKYNMFDSNFEQLYEQLYQENKYNLDQIRKNIRTRYIIEYTFGILLFVLSFYLCIKYRMSGWVGRSAGVICLVLYGMLSLTNTKHKDNYRKHFKGAIVSKFIALINPSLSYLSDVTEFMDNMRRTQKTKEIYSAVQYYEDDFTNFVADDFVEGQIDNNSNLNMADIDVRKIRGSGKYRREHVLFKGLFVNIVNVNSIDGEIRITVNKRKMDESKKKFELDNLEFEKHFDVYSNDKVLSMRVLTPDIMQNMIDFYNICGIDFDIVLKNNNIYLRFHTGPLFEPKVFGNTFDKRMLFTYYSVMQFVLEISSKISKVVKDIEA